MRLPVCIPLGIAVPPLFFWEKRRRDLLRIRWAGGFHPFHATTLLTLRLMDETLRNPCCERLLDVGCGSGILALAAAFMGVPQVVGVDVSPRAIRESLANARLNALEEKTLWLVGSTDALAGGLFHCIVANLRFHLLQAMLDDLVRLMDRSAREPTLILSGFHDTQWPLLESLCRLVGLEAVRILSQDQSFYGIPPSGSFTWVAARLRFGGPDGAPAEECLPVDPQRE